MAIMTKSLDWTLHDRTYNKVLKEVTSKPRQPVPPRERVTFHDRVICYDVMPLDEYTPEEVKASWYTVQEFNKMRCVIQFEVKQFDAGILSKQKKRGVESHGKQGKRRRHQFREGTYLAVFNEIDIQKEEEIIDEVAIADAYREHSKHAALAAQKVARKDAFSALEIYQKSFTSNKKARRS